MTKEETIQSLRNYIKELKENIKTLEQQKVGEWFTQNDGFFEWYECSKCGYIIEGEMQHSGDYDARTNYCPNCGAMMKSGE